MRLLFSFLLSLFAWASTCTALELSLIAGREHCLEHQIFDVADRSVLQLRFYPDLMQPAGLGMALDASQKGGNDGNLARQRNQRSGAEGGTQGMVNGAEREPNPENILYIHVYPPKLGASAAVYQIPETKAGKSVHITLEPYKSAAAIERRKRSDLSGGAEAQRERKEGEDDIFVPDRDFVGHYRVCFYAPASFLSSILNIIGAGSNSGGHDAVSVGSLWFQIRSSTHEVYNSIAHELLHPDEDSPIDSTAKNDRGGKPSLDEVRGAKEAHVVMKGEGASTYNLQQLKKQKSGDAALASIDLDLHLARLGLQEVTHKAAVMAESLKAAQSTSNSTFTRVWVFSVFNMIAMAIGAMLMSRQVTNELKRRRIA